MLRLFRRKFTSEQLGLLSLFLKPRKLDTPVWQEMWEQALGRPYMQTIRMFCKQGYLHRASARQCAELYTVPELKNVLRANKLKMSGRKAELIQRLADNVPDELDRLATNVEAYACTEAGMALVAPYQEKLSQAWQFADATVSQALWNGDIGRAVRTVVQYRTLLPAPMRGGLGRGVRETGLAELLTMDVPDRIDPQVFAEFRVQAATDWLWGRRFTGPREFHPIAYRTAFGAVARETLSSYAANRDVIKGVNVSAAADACEHCKQLAAKGPYTFRNAPIIPNPDCERDWCRCAYTPVLK